jgi:hypothetical protein
MTPNRQLVAAEVRATPTFAVVALRPLFADPTLSFDAYHQAYDVSPDGRAFYFFTPHRSARGARGPSIVRVDNWFADVDTKLRGAR